MSRTEKKSSLSGRTKVKTWACSCPDDAIPCKHIGALIKKWNDEPESFKIKKDLAQILKQKTKAELLSFILSATDTNETIHHSIYSLVDDDIDDEDDIDEVNDDDEHDDEDDEDEYRHYKKRKQWY